MSNETKTRSDWRKGSAFARANTKNYMDPYHIHLKWWKKYNLKPFPDYNLVTIFDKKSIPNYTFMWKQNRY